MVGAVVWKGKKRGKAGPTPVSDELRAVLRVLQEAEAPLPPREGASRLGVPPKTAARRLARAVHLGYRRAHSGVPSLYGQAARCDTSKAKGTPS